MIARVERYCAYCCQPVVFTGHSARASILSCHCGEDVTHSPVRSAAEGVLQHRPRREGKATDARQRLVDEIMALAFDQPRNPRSTAYKVGARDALLGRAMQHSVRCPFELGTEAADAWFAGNAEGHALWRAEAERQAAASETMAQAIQRASRNSEARP